MKKINNIEHFSIVEIAEKFLKNNSEKEIITFFEKGKIEGKKIEKEWYAEKKAIEEFINIFQNEKLYAIGPFSIDLTNIHMDGRILDIGGGGEAVIGQLKGEQVVVIDPNKKELEDAPDHKALSIVMDAKDLKFLDNSFETVSSFFTMMYIPLPDRKEVFQEIYRVLKNEGDFFLWDINIPNRDDLKQDVYVIVLKVKVNGNVIDTGYGTKWNKEQDAKSFIELGKEVGFKLLEQNLEPNLFFLKFRKV
ncbi:MAG: class I SAM-dependent methyltransferase [Promethearchaeota archaeon]|jgi:ubiquinone/menaquinone biosynthesis C-methylase UbiE